MEGTMEQFTEKLAGLVELGKKNKNFLEYAQIDSYFKDMKLTSDMMEAIYDYLEQNGIDVLTLAAVADDDDDLDDTIEDETEIAVPDGVSIEDPVRMYLKEIGKVPLLSADEEIKLAQRMEEGNVATEKIQLLKARMEEAEDEAEKAEIQDIYAFTREGAHSRPRILFHADITGKEITSKLLAQVKQLSNVTLLEYTTMSDIIVENDECRGIIAQDKDGNEFEIHAENTIWASG